MRIFWRNESATIGFANNRFWRLSERGANPLNENELILLREIDRMEFERRKRAGHYGEVYE